jgi:NAD(P)-dependent dehydrogenase (short-subunit alcohol dehydrogenase family)
LGSEGHDIVTAVADFSKPQDAQSAVESAERLLGPIDILINCAGAANRYQIQAYNAEAWQQGMNSKFFPQINAMDAIRPGMIQRKRGAIVNVIGMGGKSAQQVFLSGGAANAALMLTTVGWANALGRYGIRVNGINAGSTLTDRVQRGLQADAQAHGITEAEALERNQSKIPLGRFARPDEVAAVALFLASEQASYVTGAIIPMDGGSTPVI